MHAILENKGVNDSSIGEETYATHTTGKPLGIVLMHHLFRVKHVFWCFVNEKPIDSDEKWVPKHY